MLLYCCNSITCEPWPMWYIYINGSVLWYLTLLSTLFQLYRGGQYYHGHDGPWYILTGKTKILINKLINRKKDMYLLTFWNVFKCKTGLP